MGNINKIAFALDSSNISGVDAVHYNLSEGLAAHGMECVFLEIGKVQKVKQDRFIGGSNVSIPTSPLILRFLHPRGRDWSRYKQNYIHKRVQQWLQENAPICFVGGHLGFLWMENPLPGLIQLGIIHAPDEGNLAIAEAYHSIWDLHVAVSEETREVVTKRLPRLKNKLVTIPNGIKVNETITPRREGCLRILWCGRVEHKQKRVGDLIQFTRELDLKSIAYYLTIIGDGSAFEDIQNGMNKQKALGHVHFLGRLSPDEVKAQMKNHDIILLVSDYEGTPMSLLEGMACGCIPVTSTGCGGILSLLEVNFPEHLFSPGDVTKLVEIIISLDRVKGNLDALREKSLRVISESKHNLKVMARSYFDLIKSVS